MSVTFVEPDPENWDNRTKVTNLVGVSKADSNCSFDVDSAVYGNLGGQYLISVPWNDVALSANNGGWAMSTKWRTGTMWTLAGDGGFGAEARLSIAKQPGPPDTALLVVTEGG